MINKAFEPELMRQAAKKYMGGSITLPSIHTYMSKEIFRPVYYDPPPVGAGRGCKLDVADMTTLIILHRMFHLGVKFESFKSSYGRDIPSSRILFEWEAEEGQPMVLTYTDGRQVMLDRTKWVNSETPENIGINREIQKFLERFNFEVMVCICSKRTHRLPQRSIRKHEITFFSATENLRADFLSRLDATSDYDSVSFISAQSCLRQVFQ